MVSPLVITGKSKCVTSKRDTRINQVLKILFNLNLHYDSRITVLLRVQNKEQTLHYLCYIFLNFVTKFTLKSCNNFSLRLLHMLIFKILRRKYKQNDIVQKE